MQVAGLVTVPGGSWGEDNVLLKLSGVRVKVTGLVTTPGGIFFYFFFYFIKFYFRDKK